MPEEGIGMRQERSAVGGATEPEWENSNDIEIDGARSGAGYRCAWRDRCHILCRGCNA
ncbi:hypothetical protein CHELA40_14813 [Chelatococcus asaccharovorans]|nr:hypothetical protein CHELA17_60810 [Chelatococcus asaccharovorans]CAH1680125.1 hypothetical protein CHELA40_14813 [Chelatococcus asaccharovorans]